MITKCLLGVITGCAFFYALYLLVLRKKLKQPERPAAGFARKITQLFFLATFLIVNCLTSANPARGGENPTNETPAKTPEVSAIKPTVLQTLRLAWRTLYIENGQELDTNKEGMNKAIAAFKTVVEKAVSDHEIASALASNLILLHQNLAYHFWRDNARMDCYSMSYTNINSTITTRELQSQLTLLREAKQKGTLSAEVIAKATQALLQKCEGLSQLQMIETQKDADYRVQNEERKKLAAKIKNDTLAISPLTEETVTLILRLEEVEPVEADAPKK